MYQESIIMDNLAHNQIISYFTISPHMDNVKKGDLKMENNKILLTKEQEAAFVRLMKIGILKQLHNKGMLTREQLNCLLSKQ